MAMRSKVEAMHDKRSGERGPHNVGRGAPVPRSWTLATLSRYSLAMRASYVAGVVIVLALALGSPLCAHDPGEVREMLRKQGFDQLEFQRTKPPFKLDACRDGERFHLHVDFYGKIIEQTSIGRRDPATGAPTSECPQRGLLDRNR